MRMHRLLPALLLVAAPALADDDVTVRSESAAFPATETRRVSVEVPVGEIDVASATGDRVEVRLDVRCDEDSRRCRERAAAIRLRPQRDGADLSLELAGYPRNTRMDDGPQALIELRVPAGIAVRLELGVGEIEVRRVEGDVDIELGVGEALVEMDESAVRAVTLDVGVGEARLSPRPQGTRSSRFLFLGNEVDWDEGPGSARVDVEVGVGEGTVRLLP